MTPLQHLGVQILKGPAGTMELKLGSFGPKIRKHGTIFSAEEIRGEYYTCRTQAGGGEL